MAYTNTDTNMTTSEGLAPGMQAHYDRTLLEDIEPELVHLQFGEERMLPLNKGSSVNIRKPVPIPTKVTPLNEGNPGDGVMLAETETVMTIEQYGDYARVTDKLDMTHLDIKILERVERFADAGARSIDTVVREELAKSTNVLYAGGKTSRSDLTADDKITSGLILDAVKILKKNNAPRIGGYYVAIIGPDVWRELWDDELFTKVAAYQDKESVYTGEVGRIGGVRLVETTEAKIFEGAGSGGADVASVIIVGRGAYRYTSLKGAKPRVIVKPAGSAGTADPLEQISTVGWKMDGFGVKLLQPEYAVRIECGIA